MVFFATFGMENSHKLFCYFLFTEDNFTKFGGAVAQQISFPKQEIGRFYLVSVATVAKWETFWLYFFKIVSELKNYLFIPRKT